MSDSYDTVTRLRNDAFDNTQDCEPPMYECAMRKEREGEERRGKELVRTRVA